ncbi:gamma-glutamyltransferase family protein [Synechococcus sp. BA-132 BA5]|uniref:gamma-glutamyltransferase family protein n=1 Tax=Synechococcus sp. BA-132 BA5 TaxID=3110252 RepID=UPI002B20F893|nr:gamma-glutamyltransferase family protein [Synechococcus sp. BA-132 BA5]MEA5415848.1 gamma-glutamyltransferase family protein [Synechococcus sp. BA-132 BA5]
MTASQHKNPMGFLNQRSPVFTRECLASSSSPLVTQVGLAVLRDGGNAFDAAVAMAGMMAVAEPTMSGLGGDTMILAWSAPDQRAYGINGSGPAPSGASLERIGPGPFVPEHGASAVTLPGALAGWVELHKRFGSRSLEQLWEPAIRYARDGYPVGESIAGFWQIGVSMIKESASADFLATLYPDGRAPQAGELRRFPQLADTLERVAVGGREAFYAGPVAAAIAQTLTANGVPTSCDDLAAVHPEWVEPLTVSYRGYDVLGLPPNSQGIVSLQALGILDGFDLAGMDPADRLHHEIEALRIAFAFAIDNVGEPNEPMLDRVRQALSPEGLADARGRITQQALPLGRAVAGCSSDTTYLCTVDSQGNMVSLMTSIYGLFGSGLMAGDTGVILNNRASAFSTQAGHPNALAPGRRPRHSILPGLVLRNGQPVFLLGCIGQNNHPQGQLQSLVNVLDLGMNPQQAVDAPRFRVVMANDQVDLEAEFPESVRRDLEARGHQLGTGSDFMGAAQMVRIHRGENGIGPCLESGVDHRLDGVALGW